MSGLAGAVGFAAGRQVARVLLERSPYVPWAAQRPAFMHPAFNGVVHPDLPIWAGETGSSATPEPEPETWSASPRVARLSKTEMEILPDFHVQTVSGSRCRSVEEARFKIISAADAGASALLMVSGDGGGIGSGGGLGLSEISSEVHSRVNGGRGSGRGSGGGGTAAAAFYLDSVSLLREANALRAAGEIDEDVMLACVANPTAEGGGGGDDNGLGTSGTTSGTSSFATLQRLEAKIEAGAEMVITQPCLIPSRHRAWWDAVKSSGLDRDVEIIFGAGLPTSSKATRFWLGLANATHLPGADEVMAEWETYEKEMDRATFRAWCEERADLAVAEALADPAVDGVHLMPVAAGGYEAVVRLADVIHTLTELR